MKREILFRGKCKRTGRWLYGTPVYYKSGQVAIYNNDCPQYGYEATRISDMRNEVDPETIGQYTGLNDAKGNKVFEGDFVFSEQRNSAKHKISFNKGKFSIIDINENLLHTPIDYVNKFVITSNIHDL